MYNELVKRLIKRLREDKSWVEQGSTETEHEISEHIQQAADALDGFPAQVVIKGCRNCTFNIYPNQTKIVDFREDNDCPNCESDNRGDNDDT